MVRKSSASRRASTTPTSVRRTKRKPASKTKPAKFVYYFGEGKADGNGKMKPLLGGKGANLAEMTRIGLPVPPGFTISTEVCTYFYAHNRSYPRTMQAEVEEGIRRMERIMGTTFGDTKAMPLLVAVRSGARDSMPGMMDTILNLGLNDETVLAVAKATKNERFAWDCYRRFIQMYGDVVMGVQKRPEEDHEPFETVIHELKHERHHKDIDDTKLSVADLKEIVARFKNLVKERTGKQFPNDPWAQLQGSIGAVFGSWMNDRAIVYRRKYNIPQEWGTAVAAVKFACDMVREKLIEWKTAITRVPADQLDQVLAPVFDRAALKSAKAIASGLPAGPGAATGRVYFNADRAAAAAHKGEKVLLVRVETSPEDLRGMIAAEGILTARGGVSSHAALVARQMGKVCICGASALNINYRAKTMSVNGAIFREGENYLSIDGTSGTVYADQLRNAPSEIIQGLLHGDKIAQRSETYRNFNQLMDWCAKVTRMSVRTNADTPEQAENAVAFGASGIGLCRTEHMFFEGDRIDAMREMILARKADDRLKALAKLLPYQKGDFVGIFKALKGKPATIRLLDPPLHEFLPQDHAAQSALAEKIGVSQEEIARRVHELHEQNPMLGHRGCRLGISFPEVTEMQARAIFEAAAEVHKSGTKVHPEVMIPLVGFKRELELQVEIVDRVAQEVQAAKKVKFNYLVGTMIEVPRGALIADEIAETAEFFSFGTNDLTQTALGMSRDDSGSFLPHYAELEIVKRNPFATIDQNGVGQLMQIAIEKGRKTRPKIKLGICGEHGGDPDSVKFCHRLGLDYVSCSPFRVPIARLAAAQAALAK